MTEREHDHLFENSEVNQGFEFACYAEKKKKRLEQDSLDKCSRDGMMRGMNVHPQ